MEDENIDILFKALKAARKAFNSYIEKRGFDAGYWELDTLTGYTLSTDFRRLERITLQDKIEDEKDGN